jgi:hypothetical protein
LVPSSWPKKQIFLQQKLINNTNAMDEATGLPHGERGKAAQVFLVVHEARA